jgi:hypothetical protein
LPYDTVTLLHEAEITKAKNDWTKDKNGQAYISRLKHLMGTDPTAGFSAIGSQLEKQFEARLDEAHQRQGTSWR